MRSDSASDWKTPSQFPVLLPAEVHVWRFSLVVSTDRNHLLEASLDGKERERADRFRGKGLRLRFIAGRGTLRSILARYRDTLPSRIEFSYGVHGKPELKVESGGISFNLAHSGEIALLAVTKRGDVGVDIESLRTLDNAERIIERFFSASEQCEFLALPESERFAAFYLGWTRKEAFLKAKGTGLATRLDSFDVNLTPGQPAAILRVDDDFEAHRQWAIVDLDPGPGYAGALVVASVTHLPGTPDIRRFDLDSHDLIP